LPLTHITFSKKLHPHDSKNEDDDAKDEGQVSKCSHRFTHDGDEKVECGPRLGQLENTELKVEKKVKIKGYQ